jgi:hypothetical protein
MVSFTVFVGDRVVVVHDLKIMVSFAMFVRDRVVLVHDLKTMVLFTVFVRDCVTTRSLTNIANETMVFRS